MTQNTTNVNKTGPRRWVWDQSAGRLFNPDGRFQSTGYSGAGIGINNPDLQHKVKTGPIPRGMWQIQKPINSRNIGPFALPLVEIGEFTKRSLFRIHGDNVRGDRSASHGCIILPRNVRELIWKSNVHILEVVE